MAQDFGEGHHVHPLFHTAGGEGVAQTVEICVGDANLKYRYGSRSFWCRGYYVDTVGKNEKMIQDYIRNQLEEDDTSDQVSLREFRDPFTGEKRK